MKDGAFPLQICTVFLPFYPSISLYSYLASEFSFAFSRTLLTFAHTLSNANAYNEPSVLFMILSSTAPGAPKSGTASAAPPNELKTACHPYVAERPTPIPPMMPIYEHTSPGSTVYSIRKSAPPSIFPGALSLTRCFYGPRATAALST